MKSNRLRTLVGVVALSGISGRAFADPGNCSHVPQYTTLEPHCPGDNPMLTSIGGWGEMKLGGTGLGAEQIYSIGQNINVLSGIEQGGWWKVGSNDEAIAAADFDGDGADDLLVVSGWGIGILKRLSATSFETVYLAPIGTILGSWNYQGDTILAVGDFDGNGKADILVKSGWGLGILSLNSSNLLSSTWLAPFGTTIGEIQLEPTTIVVNNGPRPLYGATHSDFDGDGHADILVRGASGIGLLQQTPGTGALYSHYYAPYGTSTASSDLGGWEFSSTDILEFIGDFHNAKRAEVVIRSGWGMGTLGVTASGSFTATSLAPWGTKLAGGWTIELSDSIAAVGDYNGDSLADILVRSSVDSDGVLFSALTSSVVAAVGVQTPGGWTVGTGDRLFGAVGDLDGNGTSDIVVTSGWGVGVLTYSGGKLVTSTLSPYGSMLGAWSLANGDIPWAAGNFDGTANGSSEVLFSFPYGATE